MRTAWRRVRRVCRGSVLMVSVILIACIVVYPILMHTRLSEGSADRGPASASGASANAKPASPFGRVNAAGGGGGAAAAGGGGGGGTAAQSSAARTRRGATPPAGGAGARGAYGRTVVNRITMAPTVRSTDPPNTDDNGAPAHPKPTVPAAPLRATVQAEAPASRGKDANVWLEYAVREPDADAQPRPARLSATEPPAPLPDDPAAGTQAPAASATVPAETPTVEQGAVVVSAAMQAAAGLTAQWTYVEPDVRTLPPNPITLANGYIMNNQPQLATEPLWTTPTTSGDAQGLAFPTDPRRCRLCTFSHVCMNGTHALFPIKDAAERAAADAVLNDCTLPKAQMGGRKRPAICNCFMKGITLAFVEPGDVAKLPTQPGHFWLLDTFVRGHQIGHWAETLAFFHAIHLQERSYGLPPLRRLLINKLDPPLSDHERFIYDIAMRSLTYPVEAPLWQYQLNGPYNARCYAQMTTSSITAVTATNSADASVYRLHAFERLNRTIVACPPATTVFLFRNKMAANRRILNEKQIIDLLVDKYGITNLRHISIGEHNSSSEQAGLFAESGFVVSSHSSQLINMLFSQPGAAVLEISPAFFNTDFYQLANVMSVNHQFVIGGTVAGFDGNGTVAGCHAEFNKCAGLPSDCVVQMTWKTEKRCTRAADKVYDQYAKDVKHQNFYADLEWTNKAIQSAIGHLHRVCAAQGGWPGSTWRNRA